MVYCFPEARSLQDLISIETYSSCVLQIGYIGNRRGSNRSLISWRGLTVLNYFSIVLTAKLLGVKYKMNILTHVNPSCAFFLHFNTFTHLKFTLIAEQYAAKNPKVENKINDQIIVSILGYLIRIHLSYSTNPTIFGQIQQIFLHQFSILHSL